MNYSEIILLILLIILAAPLIWSGIQFFMMKRIQKRKEE
jgi:uncharacterized membrane protein YphA (DoxX/SURF4 family)